MRKWEVLQRIAGAGLVAVVRAGNPAQAAKIADACAAGGVAAIEISFTVPGAAEVIQCLAATGNPTGKLLIGAGTVLDPETARIAILAGAEYIVSPSLNHETARLCNRYQIPYMPGASTLREIVEAMECGAAIVKLFPGETLGPDFVKAVKAPLPQAPLMPTGGVSLDNVAAWMKAGSVAVGVGGHLTAGAKNGDFETVRKVAQEFIARIREARA